MPKQSLSPERKTPRRGLFFRILWLNLWAFILDLGPLTAGLLVGFYPAIWDWPWLWVPLGILGFWTGLAGLRLHLSTPRKLRSWVLLAARNRSELRPETFEPYFGAPCGRLLVRDVLRYLGKPQAYQGLKSQFGRGFFAPPQKKGIIIVPHGDV